MNTFADATDPGDGLDEANWRILCGAVETIHGGSVDAAANATRRFDTDVSVDGQAGMYIWYLLRYRLVDMLGHPPDANDIHDIAERFRPRFEKVIRGDRNLLEDTLRTVVSLPSQGEQVSGGKFVALGVAALGVLLDNPDADLRAIRPHLAAWWRKNLEKFRARGVLEDRSARK